MKFDIINRWSGSVQFTAEIECGEDAPISMKIGLAVKWAIKTRANLSDANLSDAKLSGAYLSGENLSGANLSRANLSRANLSSANLSRAYLSSANLSRAYLSDANLSDAYLSDANLSDANLSGAYLSGANLSGAYLSGANLSDANLSGANLSGANLSGAYLSGAYLSGANLSGANLSGANLSDANLRIIRADIFEILLTAPGEVSALLGAVRGGKIDSSTYSGECACLVGTIAKARHIPVEKLARDSFRPAERWFLGMKPGDTPENNQIAKITECWIVEFQSLVSAIRALPITEDGK